MPMSNESLNKPAKDESSKAEAKPAKADKELQQAGLSGDPAVHILMANRDGLQLQDRNAKAAIEGHQAEIKAREQQIADITTQLNELGWK